MHKKLVYKMIQNCLKQYHLDTHSLPISKEEIENLYNRILQMKEEEPSTDLFEIINDKVYEFLTG